MLFLNKDKIIYVFIYVQSIISISYALVMCAVFVDGYLNVFSTT